MPLISNADRERLRAAFAGELEGKVSVKLSIAANDRGSDLARDLLSEITALSSKMSLQVVEELVQAPTIVLTGRLKGTLRFIGLPLGYELPVFIDAIKLSSTGWSTLTEMSRERLAALDSERRVRVFATPD